MRHRRSFGGSEQVTNRNTSFWLKGNGLYKNDVPRHSRFKFKSKHTRDSRHSEATFFSRYESPFSSSEFQTANRNFELKWPLRDSLSRYSHPDVGHKDEFTNTMLRSTDALRPFPPQEEPHKILWLEEPPSEKIFSNSSGGEIRCRVAGNGIKYIEWRYEDGVELPEVNRKIIDVALA